MNVSTIANYTTATAAENYTTVATVENYTTATTATTVANSTNNGIIVNELNIEIIIIMVCSLSILVFCPFCCMIFNSNCDFKNCKWCLKKLEVLLPIKLVFLCICCKWKELKEIFECKKKVTTIKHIEHIELFEIVVTQPKERIDDCVICYQNYGKEKVGILKCNHTFHEKCIEKWLHVSKNKDCPTCRKKIDIIKL